MVSSVLCIGWCILHVTTARREFVLARQSKITNFMWRTWPRWRYIQQLTVRLWDLSCGRMCHNALLLKQIGPQHWGNYVLGWGRKNMLPVRFSMQFYIHVLLFKNQTWEKVKWWLLSSCFHTYLTYVAQHCLPEIATLVCAKPRRLWHQGSHGSWKVLKNEELKIRPWKVLKFGIGPEKVLIFDHSEKSVRPARQLGCCS